MSNLLNELKEKASKAQKTIVLPEGGDERVVRAAGEIAKTGLAKIVLLGDEQELKTRYTDIDFTKLTVINPKTSDKLSLYANLLFELRKSKGMTEAGAYALAQDELYFGVLMVKHGDADGMVGGACHSTGDLLRPALQIIKTAPGISTVSSCFVMLMPENCPYKKNDIFLFGDCAVNPDPTAEQLKDIAISSFNTAKSLTDIEPKVAMLSFSTKGSAKHANVDKVVNATKMVQQLAPEILIDGELQADAALVESVGKLKSPDSKVAGEANVLIFPDLQSGNIGYKLVQRLAGAEAIGPICQGFNKPVNDLSRGCSVEDIVNVVAITICQGL